MCPKKKSQFQVLNILEARLSAEDIRINPPNIHTAITVCIFALEMPGATQIVFFWMMSQDVVSVF